MALRKFILAGVPEQVNIPIHLGLEHQLFRKYGVNLEFKIVPEVYIIRPERMLYILFTYNNTIFVYRVQDYY